MDARRPPQEEERESKITLSRRSAERAHSTEHSDEEPITEINVAPLVDVALVLVIIFMAVSPFMLQAGLTVTESKAGAATGKASLDENVQIGLAQDGKITLNGEEVAPNDLTIALKIAIPKSKDGLVTVQADPANRVGTVVQVLDIAKQAGAKKVALLNKKEEAPAAAAPAP
jgi:biopolymer transport protein ExbD